MALTALLDHPSERGTALECLFPLGVPFSFRTSETSIEHPTIEPLLSASELFVVRRVTTRWAVCVQTTFTTNGHSPIRLWCMVLIEACTHLRS